MTRTPPTRTPSLQECRTLVEEAVHAATGVHQPSLLARELAPAIYLRRTRPSWRVQSRQGGRPRGVRAWPHFEGRPQWFLLGIRLSELRGLDHGGLLPPRGWLNFFMPPEVMTGTVPLNACTVTYTPRETVLPVRGPTHNPLNWQEGLHFIWGVQYGPEQDELTTPDEYDAAWDEEKALTNSSDNRPTGELELIHNTDYLLGKQSNANVHGTESWRNVAAFAREQHGRDDIQLRALLSLTDFRNDWPFFCDTNVLSVTFFIEESDLKACRFDRVIVDVAVSA